MHPADIVKLADCEANNNTEDEMVACAVRLFVVFRNSRGLKSGIVSKIKPGIKTHFLSTYPVEFWFE